MEMLVDIEQQSEASYDGHLTVDELIEDAKSRAIDKECTRKSSSEHESLGLGKEK